MVGTRGPARRQIAVLADEELVGALRLAGVRLARSMQCDPAAAPGVRELLQEWVVDERIGVIIIAEDLAALVKDQLHAWRTSRGVFPVILQIPSPGAAGPTDVKEYYSRLSREFLGLEIVLEESLVSPAGRRPGAA